MIKAAFTLLVLVAVGFAGVSFGKPYYRYQQLNSRTKDILYMEIGVSRLDLIKEKVEAEAKDLGIPLEEGDLEVTVNNNKIIIVRAAWTDTVDFWGYYRKSIDFEMRQEY